MSVGVALMASSISGTFTKIYYICCVQDPLFQGQLSCIESRSKQMRVNPWPQKWRPCESFWRTLWVWTGFTQHTGKQLICARRRHTSVPNRASTIQQ